MSGEVRPERIGEALGAHQIENGVAVESGAQLLSGRDSGGRLHGGWFRLRFGVATRTYRRGQHFNLRQILSFVHISELQPDRPRKRLISRNRPSVARQLCSSRQMRLARRLRTSVLDRRVQSRLEGHDSQRAGHRGGDPQPLERLRRGPTAPFR